MSTATVTFGVLGPIVAWDQAGRAVALGGPRHRAIVGRLLVARTQVVSLDRLIDDLWLAPPASAASAIRTFVGDLRRALEPDRPARAPASLLTTEGPGYALRVEPHAVDAWRFEQAVELARDEPPATAAARLRDALALWRGPAFADLPDDEWARGEARRLDELRMIALERSAAARIRIGQAADTVADLEAHAAGHPWREEGWRLLALALYLGGRQVEALSVLRRARELLDEFGLEPSAELRDTERRILQHDPALRGRSPVDELLQDTASAYTQVDQTARLQATVSLLRELAVTGGGGLVKARANRAAVVAVVDELDDPTIAARVIGSYDVPAVWTRSDDPVESARVVRTARRVAGRLRSGADDALLTRVLATIAIESRGTDDIRAAREAFEAERIARALGDPASLAFALNAVWMQSFGRAGFAPRRSAIGAELVAVSSRHGLASFEILGHLIRMQALSATGDFVAADEHAAAAQRLGDAHNRPLVAFFVTWYRALRTSAADAATATDVEAAYARAAALVGDAGMDGVTAGLQALTALCLHLRHGTATPAIDADWGPYAPWTRPVVLALDGSHDDARQALRAQPVPTPGHMLELQWSLTAIAAAAVDDEGTLRRAHTHLRPAMGELAGAGSGLLTLGPVAELPIGAP